MSKVVLWGRPSSTNTQKAIWMLVECGIQFELRHASAWLGPGQNLYSEKDSMQQFDAVVDSQEYRKMNPNGTVPTLVVPSGAIYESHSILRFLARSFKPELLSGSGSRPIDEATASIWLDWTLACECNGKFPMKGIIDHSSRLDEKERDSEQLASFLEEMAQALAIPDAQLGRTPYLAGDSLSVADMPLAVDFCRYKFALDSPAARRIPATRHKRISDMTLNINSWYKVLCERREFADTVHVSAALHASAHNGGKLPTWLAAYLDGNSTRLSKL